MVLYISNQNVFFLTIDRLTATNITIPIYVAGLFVLLPPQKSKNGVSGKKKKGNVVEDRKDAEAILSPHLHHLIAKEIPSATCPWNLSGPQFPKPTSLQQRYCYPRGSKEYSKGRAAALWTAYDTNGVEKTDFRLLHVYTSEKRGNSNVDGHTEESGPDKRAKHMMGVSPTVSFLNPVPANQSPFRHQHHRQSHHQGDPKNYIGHPVDSRYGYSQQFSHFSPINGKDRYSKLNRRFLSPPSRVKSVLPGSLMNRSVGGDAIETEKDTSGKKGGAVEENERYEIQDVVLKSASGSSSVTQPTSNTQAATDILRDDLEDFEDDEHYGLGNMSGLPDFTFPNSFDNSDSPLLGDRDEAFYSEQQKHSCRWYPSYPPHQQLGQYPHQYHHQYHHQDQHYGYRVRNCQQLEALLRSTHQHVLSSIRLISPLEQGRFLSVYSEWGKMVSRFPLQDLSRSLLGQHPPAQQAACYHGSVQYPHNNAESHQQQLMPHHYHHRHHAQPVQPHRHHHQQQQQDPYATPPRYPIQERRAMPKPVPKRDSTGSKGSNKHVLVKEQEQERTVERGAGSSLLSIGETEKVAEV